MLEVEVRPRALLDIDSLQIHLTVCTGGFESARRFTDDIYAAMERLQEFPDMGAVSPYCPAGSLVRYRRLLVSKMYWVYYSHDDEKLTIWRIIHSKQDVDDYAILDV